MSPLGFAASVVLDDDGAHRARAPVAGLHAHALGADDAAVLVAAFLLADAAVGHAGTFQGPTESKREMKRTRLILALTTVALAACGSDEPTTPSAVPDPVEMEQALELIESCGVTGVGGTHAGEMELSLEGGRTVRVADPDSDALWRTAEKASERCGGIEIYTE